MKRIHIIGMGGKTSLAIELSARLGIPHTELDSIFWYPDWQHSPPGVFESQVEEITMGGTWIVDGNYSRRVRPIIWQRADTVVWLDYPLVVCLWRLFKRTTSRIITGEALWGTNRETFRKAFLSKDSLFLYVIRHHRSRKEKYEMLIELPEHAEIVFIRLRTPKQTQRWLEKLFVESKKEG